MEELERIKKILKENNIKTRKSKNGLFIYAKYTTFYISNYDLELKGYDSLKYNNWLLETIIEKNGGTK